MSAILFYKENNILNIVLNRPQALNALDESIFNELLHLLKQDDPSIRGLILKGAGEKAFCAGADLKALEKMNSKSTSNYLKLANLTIDTLENYSKPTIALIHGYTLGGGLELALACDFLIADEKSILGMPETKLGLIPGFHGGKRLAARVGSQKTKELIFSGKTMTAQEALQIKLIDMIVKYEFMEKMALETFNSFSQEIKALSLAKTSLLKENTDPYFLEAVEAMDWKKVRIK